MMETMAAKLQDTHLPHPAKQLPLEPPHVLTTRESQLMLWKPTNVLGLTWTGPTICLTNILIMISMAWAHRSSPRPKCLERVHAKPSHGVMVTLKSDRCPVSPLQVATVLYLGGCSSHIISPVIGSEHTRPRQFEIRLSSLFIFFFFFSNSLSLSTRLPDLAVVWEICVGTRGRWDVGFDSRQKSKSQKKTPWIFFPRRF